jgi:hypothetical protein
MQTGDDINLVMYPADGPEQNTTENFSGIYQISQQTLNEPASSKQIYTANNVCHEEQFEDPEDIYQLDQMDLISNSSHNSEEPRGLKRPGLPLDESRRPGKKAKIPDSELNSKELMRRNRRRARNREAAQRQRDRRLETKNALETKINALETENCEWERKFKNLEKKYEQIAFELKLARKSSKLADTLDVLNSANNSPHFYTNKTTNTHAIKPTTQKLQVRRRSRTKCTYPMPLQIKQLKLATTTINCNQTAACKHSLHDDSTTTSKQITDSPLDFPSPITLLNSSFTHAKIRQTPTQISNAYANVPSTDSTADIDPAGFDIDEFIKVDSKVSTEVKKNVLSRQESFSSFFSSVL